MLPHNAARLEHMTEVFEDLTRRARDLNRRTTQATASADSPKREVSVTVGFGGALTKVEFDPDAYRRLSPREMADLIQQAATAATTALNDRVAQAHRQLYGEQFDLFGLERGEVDPVKLLRDTSARLFA
ncbi:MAG TPA: YbaB/EbfC family nucleoid-associated protein [Stackebrandtia sp.]|jgi:DNA-binding protein YbaB|uniref:YbaB/EbfC family nucleoid-associated protein n=1 Tax=Stackebrandtia sp. TaxID=2023065 RepID=UPI002D5FF42A|nr:YbaB/EbfC family nucleoid-associated protein [Stackebrandtia sp.]HZE40743.1 YbaB/EbfC family nucleoid-associated protein [Stackebrandtia sp.]